MDSGEGASELLPRWNEGGEAIMRGRCGKNPFPISPSPFLFCYLVLFSACDWGEGRGWGRIGIRGDVKHLQSDGYITV